MPKSVPEKKTNQTFGKNSGFPGFSHRTSLLHFPELKHDSALDETAETDWATSLFDLT